MNLTLRMPTRPGRARPDGIVRVEFDGDRLRIDPQAQRDAKGYMIAREGKAYAVTRQDGKPMVIDVGAMMQMLGPMLKQMAPPQTFDDVGEFKGIRARLLERVFDIDMRRCPSCGAGELEIIAAILERAAIEKLLTHLGLDPQPPPGVRTKSWAA